MLKDAVSAEIGQLHKTNALLIATQFAANHECEFDASAEAPPVSWRCSELRTGSAH